MAPVISSPKCLAVTPRAFWAAIAPRTVSVVRAVMTRQAPSSVMARTTLSDGSVKQRSFGLNGCGAGGDEAVALKQRCEGWLASHEAAIKHHRIFAVALGEDLGAECLTDRSIEETFVLEPRES